MKYLKKLIFSYFNKKNKKKRRLESKKEYSDLLTSYSEDLEEIINLLNRLQSSATWVHMKVFIDTLSSAVKCLNKYYEKFVKDDDDYPDYIKEFEKINSHMGFKLKMFFTGWSFGYNPQAILYKAKRGLINHKKNIESYLN